MQRSLGLCVLLLLPAGLEAEVGDLTIVAQEPGLSLLGADLNAQGESFANRAEGDGTVSPNAVIATLKSNVPSGLALKAAIDSKSPEAKAPDVVRLDFTGEGKFDGAPVVPLDGKQRGPIFAGQFGPATIEIQRDGKTIPIRVQGMYQKSQGFRYMSLMLGTAMEGNCRFGDKTHRIRIIDGNSNLQHGDEAKPSLRGGKICGFLTGDTLAVDTGDGKFGESVIKSFYGCPLLVDGAWYDVTLSDDGTKVTASPSDVKTAKLKIAHDRWQMTLLGKKHILYLSGSAEAVEIPADSYCLAGFQQQVKDTSGGGASLASGRMDLWNGRAKTFDAPAGQTVEPAVGTPLTASISAKISGRSVQMDFSLVDAGGAGVDYVSSGQGGQPTPKVEVLDAKGERVHAGKFEYG